MACSPGSKATWQDIHDIAASLDQLAASKGVSSYNDLGPRTPFNLTGTVPWECDYKFILAPGTGPAIIQSQMTSKAVPNTVSSLASSGDLYFVVDADGCWCQTIFQVKNRELFQVPQNLLGCCQSLPVPPNGTDLAAPNAQKWIPSSYVRMYRRTGSAEVQVSGTMVQGKACVSDSSNRITYYFTGSGSGTDSNSKQLIQCWRKLNGYLTWKIRKKDPTDLKTAMEQILAGSGGSNGSSFYAFEAPPGSSEEHPVIIEDCPVKWADLVYTTQHNNEPAASLPGCLMPDGSQPWQTPTCGAGSCSQGPHATCNTMEHWRKIIALAQNLKQYDPEIGPASPCSNQVLSSATLCAPNCDTDECRGKQTEWDLSAFTEEDYLGRSCDKRCWFIYEGSSWPGMGYASGGVSPSGTLEGLPSKFTGLQCYPGNMKLEVRCNDDCD